MGVPKLDIFEAIDLFAEIGYDGIEVRVQHDGQINASTYTAELGRRILRRLADRGLEICCLTPYCRDFVHPEEREAELAAFRRVIDIAAKLRCPIVRSYGGISVPEGEEEEAYWNRTVSGIRACAAYAQERQISIAVETHLGSLTFSATDTLKMIQAVDRPNVGVLFDYAWVDLRAEETPEAAFDMIRPHLLHCHVKDWVVHERETMEKTSCLMGEGDVPWPPMLQMIAQSGYDGYVVDEYEKYWYDHLPDAAVGMRRNLEYVQTVLRSEADAEFRENQD